MFDTPVSSAASEEGTTLSRSSSSCSTISDCSDISSTSDRNFENGDDVGFIEKKRKRTPEHEHNASDSQVVTDPILRHFDVKWMDRSASQHHRTDNPLYEFKVRPGFTVYADENSRPRKKYQDMVLSFFKKESHSIIWRGGIQNRIWIRRI